MTSRARLDAWRARRVDPLTFILDGRTFTVPEHPARVWVMAILSDASEDLLLDVLDPDEADDLWDQTQDPEDDLDVALLHRIGQELLARVGGRPWWQVTMLVATLVDRWDEFIAVARDRALGDPLTWPLDELCSWVYLRLTMHMKPEEQARLDAELSHPPMPDFPDDATDDELLPGEAEGWLALAAQFG